MYRMSRIASVFTAASGISVLACAGEPAQAQFTVQENMTNSNYDTIQDNFPGGPPIGMFGDTDPLLDHIQFNVPLPPGMGLMGNGMSGTAYGIPNRGGGTIQFSAASLVPPSAAWVPAGGVIPANSMWIASTGFGNGQLVAEQQFDLPAPGAYTLTTSIKGEIYFPPGGPGGLVTLNYISATASAVSNVTLNISGQPGQLIGFNPAADTTQFNATQGLIRCTSTLQFDVQGDAVIYLPNSADTTLAQANQTPAPASLLVFGPGLLGFLYSVRRRSAQRNK